MLKNNPKYIHSECNFFYNFQKEIKRKAFDFESKLSHQYNTPIIYPIPDDLINTEIPRFILESKHGYSKIITTQTRLQLLTDYDKNYWNDFNKVYDYWFQHTKSLWETSELLLDTKPIFAGLILKIYYPFNEQNEVNYLTKKFIKHKPINEYQDLNLRYVIPLKNTYYLNIHISNYREYSSINEKIDNSFHNIPSLRNLTLNEEGISVVLDFNNRLQYNNKPSYNFNFNIIKNLFKFHKIFANQELFKILKKGSVDYV